MNGLALIRAMDWTTSASRSGKASHAQVGRRPVSATIDSLNPSSVNVRIPQSVWWMSTISVVPKRRWLIVSDRMPSSVSTTVVRCWLAN